MYCPNCGKEVMNNSKFCFNCGFNLSSLNSGENEFGQNSVDNNEQGLQESSLPVLPYYDNTKNHNDQNNNQNNWQNNTQSSQQDYWQNNQQGFQQNRFNNGGGNSGNPSIPLELIFKILLAGVAIYFAYVGLKELSSVFRGIGNIFSYYYGFLNIIFALMQTLLVVVDVLLSLSICGLALLLAFKRTQDNTESLQSVFYSGLVVKTLWLFVRKIFSCILNLIGYGRLYFYIDAQDISLIVVTVIVFVVVAGILVLLHELDPSTINVEFFKEKLVGGIAIIAVLAGSLKKNVDKKKDNAQMNRQNPTFTNYPPQGQNSPNSYMNESMNRDYDGSGMEDMEDDSCSDEKDPYSQNSYEQNPYGGQNSYSNQNPYGGQSSYGNQNPYNGQNSYGNQNNNSNFSGGYSASGPIRTDRSLIKYILFNFITCGIYSFFFIHDWAKDINTMCEGDGEHTSGLLAYIIFTTITCGIYAIYWEYKIGNRLQRNSQRYCGQMFTENGTTILMWGLFGALICFIGPFIAMNIMIENTNKLAAGYNAAHNM